MKKENTAPNALGESAVCYIKAHLADELTRDALCRALSTNRTTLSRAVIAYTGKTVRQFIAEERVRAAEALLRKGKKPVAEIAQACGFHDPCYFNRTFKRIYGKTPRAYRANCYDTSVNDLLNAFRRLAVKGRGEAVLLLRAQKNKLPFLHEVKRFCLWRRSDGPYQNGQMIAYRRGEYERFLCESFDDPDALKSELVDALLSRDDPQDASIVCALGGADKAMPVYEQAYTRAREALKEVTALIQEDISSPALNEKDRRYPPEAGEYIDAALALLTLVPTEECFERILGDVADFYDLSDYPPVPTYQNPYYRMADNLYGGLAKSVPAVDRVVNSHRNGEKLKRHCLHQPLPSTIPAYTAAEFIEEAKKNTPDVVYFISFANSNEETRAEVAKELLTTRSSRLRRKLAEYFIDSRYIQTGGPTMRLFPLDPTDILNKVKEWDAKGYSPEDTRISEFPTALSLLDSVSCRCAALRAYGLDLIRAYKPNGADMHAITMASYGIGFAYGANFEEGDERELKKIFSIEDGKLTPAVITTVLTNLDAGFTGYSKEFLKTALDRSDAFRRVSFVRKLFQHSLIQKDWCEALSFDADKYIRAIAEEYLKTH